MHNAQMQYSSTCDFCVLKCSASMAPMLRLLEAECELRHAKGVHPEISSPVEEFPRISYGCERRRVLCAVRMSINMSNKGNSW